MSNANGTTNGRLDDTHWRVLQDNCLADMVAERRDRSRVKPMTRNHAVYLDAIPANKLTICLGPAGTGKTYMACGMAADMLRAGKVERIVVARPLLSCDEEMGFLKGDMEDKVGPYMAPLLEAFEEFFSGSELAKYADDGTIEVCPLAVMRGRTFKNAFVILDEAQNATRRQLKMFLTRSGKGTRSVVCGDTTQTDLPKGQDRNLVELADLLSDDPEIGVVYMTEDDIVRSDLVGRIVRRLSRW